MLRGPLLFLIFLRLLWPPGVCVCHLFDREPVPHHHDHDDHLPGCPASKIAVTLCSMKQDAPRLSDLPAPPVPLVVLVSDRDVPPTASADLILAAERPIEPPLYLTLRAWRI